MFPEFEIVRDDNKCIRCGVCVRRCANDVHSYDEENDSISSDSAKCVACQRCVTLCPTGALAVKKAERTLKGNANFTPEVINTIYKQAESGGVVLTGMGNPLPLFSYFDHMLLDAARVTEPFN